MHRCQLRIGSHKVWTNHCLKLSPGQGRWRLSVPNHLKFRGSSSEGKEAELCCFTPTFKH